MRMRSRLLPGLAAAALLVAACETDDGPDIDDPIEDIDDDPAEDDTVEDDEAVGDNDAAEDDDVVEDDAIEDDDVADDQAVAEGEVLAVGESDLGEHLVDGEGLTVYINALDETMLEDEGEPSCTGDCVAVWTPLMVADDQEPEVGEGVDTALLDTIERPDAEILGATHQLTYDGHPLYTFVTDGEPGDTLGQELADLWYALAADGEPIGELPDEEELEELDMDEEEAEE